MTQRKIKVPRKKVSNAQKILRAITKKDTRKRHRAVASSPAAGFNDDGQALSTKITRALFILLLFHIFAVIGIFIHSKMTKDAVAKRSQIEPVAAMKKQGALERIDREGSRISKDEAYAWINPGDTYQTIAKRLSVDVNELKKLNRNRSIKAGEAIKIPIRRRVNVVSPEIEAIKGETSAKVEQVTSGVHRIVDLKSRKKDKVEVAVVEKRKKAQANGRYILHDFKMGETFWALSRRYNVSVQSIQRMNPKINPNAIRVGTKIKIPQ